ncbi:hypothetical protein ACFL6F_01495 [Planctomycetota bacterium]
MDSHKKRHKGMRWTVVYGEHEGVRGYALIELQKAVQQFLPYVIEIVKAEEWKPDHSEHVILAGTAECNKYIREFVSDGKLDIPKNPEAYSIQVMDSPLTEKGRLIVIAGNDSNGFLYGVQELKQILEGIRSEGADQEELRDAFDNLSDLVISDYPRIRYRGIWSWGYVIYDYRRFFDNMAKLRLNMITIWNDSPPLNCNEVIEYAHSRGIRVFLGFHWGWGRDDLSLAQPEDHERVREMVLNEYESNYKNLDIDGIYFQTLTEHHDKELGKRTVASLACELVNKTAKALLEIKPELEIHFGLHAISIADRYPDLKDLDERVTIMWEDAGVIPFGYMPKPEQTSEIGINSKDIVTFEQTLDYSKKIACLRKGERFAMVAKGWIHIDWSNEFEHHGPFILGECDPKWIKERLAKRQPLWDRTNPVWEKNYPLAAQFYREILTSTDQPMTVLALIEDGMFEEVIQPSAALFAETVWNPEQDADCLFERAEVRTT